MHFAKTSTSISCLDSFCVYMAGDFRHSAGEWHYTDAEGKVAEVGLGIFLTTMDSIHGHLCTI